MPACRSRCANESLCLAKRTDPWQISLGSGCDSKASIEQLEKHGTKIVGK
jgi:hypothetical protein